MLVTWENKIKNILFKKTNEIFMPLDKELK
jgi:hypothetical protein